MAVADRVTGPYVYRGSFRPNARAWPRGIRPEQKARVAAAAKHEYSGGELPDEPDRLNIVARDFDGGQMARDQTLFVDDDGAAYHVYASEENSTLHVWLPRPASRAGAPGTAAEAVVNPPVRGEVWLADLNPTRGHEQARRRPVLVVSDDLFNRGPAGLAEPSDKGSVLARVRTWPRSRANSR